MKISIYHYTFLCCHSYRNDDYFESNEFNLQYKTDQSGTMSNFFFIIDVNTLGNFYGESFHF